MSASVLRGAPCRPLVTDGGRGSSRSALATVRALHDAGRRAAVTVSGGEELAAVSRAADRSYDVPPVSDGPAFAASIEALRRDGCHAPVFATSDDGLRALEVPGTELVDKEVLAARAADHDIAAPASDTFHDIEAIRAADLPYPVVVKPAVGALPAVRVDRAAELERLPSTFGRVVVQPFLTGEMVAIGGVMWAGELRAAIHQRYVRRWPIECGTASAAISIEVDRAREEALVALLGDYQGVFQAQYIGAALIDVNPRPYGSMALATAAGVNLPGIFCELMAGEPGEPCRRAVTGVRYRWVEGDLRHIVSGLRSGSLPVARAARALGPHRGTAHSVVSLRDPKPALLRARQVLRRVRTSRS